MNSDKYKQMRANYRAQFAEMQTAKRKASLKFAHSGFGALVFVAAMAVILTLSGCANQNQKDIEWKDVLALPFRIIGM